MTSALSLGLSALLPATTELMAESRIDWAAKACFALAARCTCAGESPVTSLAEAITLEDVASGAQLTGWSPPPTIVRGFAGPLERLEITPAIGLPTGLALFPP